MKTSFLIAALVGTLLSGAVVEVAEAQRSFSRDRDTVERENGRMGTASSRQRTGINGGTVNSQGRATYNPETGAVRGVRGTSIQGRNGGSATSTTSVSGTKGDYDVDRNTSCTNSSGDACR